MFLFYLDESGDPGDPRIVNTPTKNLVLSGFAIHEGQWRLLARKMDDLQEKYFPSSPDLIEFHSCHVRHGTKEFAKLSHEQRAELIGDVYSVIRTHGHGPVLFAVDIDKNTLPTGEHPYARAFEELYSRFDLFLKRKFSKGDPHKGILIFDNSSLRDRISRQVAEFHRIGTRWSSVENMIEAPFFLDSKNTRVVQIADFVASAVFQYFENQDDGNLGRILPKFDREGGKIHGLGTSPGATHALVSLVPRGCDRFETNSRAKPRHNVGVRVSHGAARTISAGSSSGTAEGTPWASCWR